MKKLLFVIAVSSALLSSAFAAESKQETKVSGSEPVVLEKISITLLRPASKFEIDSIEIGQNTVEYHVRGGFEGTGSYKFVANHDGTLVDLVIFKYSREVPVFEAQRMLILGSSVVTIDSSFKGESYQVSIPEWQQFFEEKIRQPIRIAKDDRISVPMNGGLEPVYELVGMSLGSNGVGQVIVLDTLNRSLLRSFDESEFITLPRKGVAFRLGKLSGKYLPVEMVKIGEKMVMAVVVSETTDRVQ